MATKEQKTGRWNAGLYEGKHAFVWELAKELVPLLGPKAGERILDIGCGTGHLTAEIAASGARVVGIDRSEEMIAEARKKYPGLRFEVMDARELEKIDLELLGGAALWPHEAVRAEKRMFPQGLKPLGKGRLYVGTEAPTPMFSGGCCTGSDAHKQKAEEMLRLKPELLSQEGVNEEQPVGWFDGVFSNATLHWIKEPERVIAGIARALRPGGRFVAEFGGKGNIAELVAAFRRACKALGLEFSEEMSPWYFPSVGEYAYLLEQNGLEVRQAALFDRPTPLEDGERGLRAWMEMFGGAIVNSVPEAKREALLKGLEREARAALFHEGQWVVDYRRLRVVAGKAAKA
jgi:SAM-dependent methyltransferase